jgi:hypothetical protein
MDSAQYAVKYLAHTKNLGIQFTSMNRPVLESSLHLPLPPCQVLSMYANWGPQDATVPTIPIELPLFASRLMSAFFIDILGPVHRLSK